MLMESREERNISSLIDIMGRLQLTYNDLAREIGVSRTTVFNFMKYGVIPQVRTYYKINEYIKQKTN